MKKKNKSSLCHERSHTNLHTIFGNFPYKYSKYSKNLHLFEEFSDCFGVFDKGLGVNENYSEKRNFADF